MRIRAVRLELTTSEGLFGYSFRFDGKLNIIRGGNSSGKSTVFNSILYGLGLEELIGGRGPKVLPYAVREYFEWEGSRLFVDASDVLVEIESAAGEIATLRRSIKSLSRDPKLVEIFRGGQIEQIQGRSGEPSYVHDAGAATGHSGFHRFLEEFIGFSLPSVATTKGGATRLYIQAVLAACCVEQKRGWTDYIANIPFFGIRDARSRVVEFLLGLDVFKLASERATLAEQLREQENAWSAAVATLRSQSAVMGVRIENLAPEVGRASLDAKLVATIGVEELELPSAVERLRQELTDLQRAIDSETRVSGDVEVDRLAVVVDELGVLSSRYQEVTANLHLAAASREDLDRIRLQIDEDLAKNKAVRKLRDLGAEISLSLAKDMCPTCHQAVDENVLFPANTGAQMDLLANIGYLESQRRMVSNQQLSVQSGIERLQIIRSELARQTADKRDEVSSLRAELSNGTSDNRSRVKRQVRLETRIEQLESVESLFEDAAASLASIEAEYLILKEKLGRLPRSEYSDSDAAAISLFRKLFRSLAASFDYQSADIGDIDISEDGFVPTLAQIELKEIRPDIKADSSASDFVRLIWSYLIGIWETSSKLGRTSHPNFLMFDEPGQHSMADHSQRAFLQTLAAQGGLQSIVAASFDESESVFREATRGVEFHLVQWSGKVIQRL